MNIIYNKKFDICNSKNVFLQPWYLQKHFFFYLFFNTDKIVIMNKKKPKMNKKNYIYK